MAPPGLALRFRIVDVFSERPLAGNALCVVLDDCPAQLQQAVAREVNLSETTFPTVAGDRAYDTRIYTPVHELPFAGHPTLGTAWVLGEGLWEQRSAGATVTVEVDAGGARMRQPAPTFEPQDAQVSASLAAALGLPSTLGVQVAAAAGNRHVVVPTEAPIDALTPDLVSVRRLAAPLGSFTVAVVRVLDETTLHVRVFVPGAGIAEDPGTGSAAGPIAVLAHERLGAALDVTIRQGDEIARPCRIEVHADPDDLWVGGRVAACAEGVFSL